VLLGLALCSWLVLISARPAWIDGLVAFARVWIWVALAAWAVVSVVTLMRGLVRVRRPAPCAELSRDRP
jgi:hypothetical protein